MALPCTTQPLFYKEACFGFRGGLVVLNMILPSTSRSVFVEEENSRGVRSGRDPTIMDFGSFR